MCRNSCRSQIQEMVEGLDSFKIKETYNKEEVIAPPVAGCTTFLKQQAMKKLCKINI